MGLDNRIRKQKGILVLTETRAYLDRMARDLMTMQSIRTFDKKEVIFLLAGKIMQNPLMMPDNNDPRTPMGHSRELICREAIRLCPGFQFDPVGGLFSIWCDGRIQNLVDKCREAVDIINQTIRSLS